MKQRTIAIIVVAAALASIAAILLLRGPDNQQHTSRQMAQGTQSVDNETDLINAFYAGNLEKCSTVSRTINEELTKKPRIAAILATVGFIKDIELFRKHKDIFISAKNEIEPWLAGHATPGKSPSLINPALSLLKQANKYNKDALSYMQKYDPTDKSIPADLYFAAITKNPVSATLYVKGKGSRSNSFGCTNLLPTKGYKTSGTINTALSDMKFKGTITGWTLLSKNMNSGQLCRWALLVTEGSAVLNKKDYDSIIKGPSRLYPGNNIVLRALNYNETAFLIELPHHDSRLVIPMQDY
jgi:hypothetical protein